MHSRKLIDSLFERGKSMSVSPLKMVYMPAAADQKFPAQAMFVVPKRQFKKAHDRNKLKRRMREAYRLHKQEFYSTLAGDKKIILAFIYTSSKPLEFGIIEKAILKQLKVAAGVSRA